MNRQQRMASSINALAKKRRMQLDLQDAAYMTVPYAYATIVMALKESTDMTDDDIIYIIQRSHDLWDNWTYDTEDPLDVCARVTGIRLEGYKK